MDLIIWYLILENVILLPAIGLFLYLKQRPYTIIGCILLIILIGTDIAFYIGYRGGLAGLPTIAVFIVGFLIRPFLPQPRITTNPRVSKSIALILISLIVIVILFIVIFFAPWSGGNTR